MARILVVDDEADIRESTKVALESMGHTVLMAKDGKDALQAVRREAKLDLVILDFFMPEMSGREVLEEMRKDKKTANIKVAMMTVARLGEAGEKELKKLKVSDFIPKPVDLQDFKARISKLLKA